MKRTRGSMGISGILGTRSRAVDHVEQQPLRIAEIGGTL
jgi:hypothetical protein